VSDYQPIVASRTDLYGWQTPRMSSADWPLLDLQITPDASASVRLRTLREVDLPQLAALLPDDSEHDPGAEQFPGLDVERHRQSLVYRSYWRSWGTWSPSSWNLKFAVEHRDKLVGMQSLEAEDFPLLRTVDSSSWLIPDVRGQGVGIAMRRAVLGLAFDHIGAVAAVTSARKENQASLGVSRHLGYRDNGVSLTDSPTGVAELQHMRLTADQWRSSGLGLQVVVDDFEDCRPWFGLPIE
jgi:RimJ/RimL family protein N-acetyltransferase